MLGSLLVKLKRGLWSAGPVLLLCFINVVTFRSHFMGVATFPWDFVGGYHAQAFGWFDQGSIFDPPVWFPWTNMGFPAFLALQSGAWYLPLALIHAIGVTYTIHVATVFQVLHVLFGAVGVYFLARRLGGLVVVALIVAVGYHFSATFYSNQEHVDIIRAVAWFPWLLYAVHPLGFIKTRWNTLIVALILSQLLVAGYPGNIVAIAYAAAIWVGMLMWAEEGLEKRCRYVASVALGVIAGILISMPKWLPLILNGSSGIEVEHLPSGPFLMSHLLTLLTPYDVDILQGDRTMRSVWLPLTCIWGLAFASLRSGTVRIGLMFIAMAIFMGMLVPKLGPLLRVLPGVQVSRFPLSDWRPVLQIGLIFASIDGWTRLLRRECSQRRSIFGSVTLLGLGTALVIVAIHFGFEASELARVLIVLFLAAALTICMPIAWSSSTRPHLLAIEMGVMLVAFTAADGYQYQMSQQAPWRANWNAQVEQQTLGPDAKALMLTSKSAAEVHRRPRRMLIGESTAEALAQRNSPLYNRCWYGRSYCVFGYDNLRMSVPHTKFIAALSQAGGEALLRFAARPQQLLALSPGSEDVIPDVPATDEAAVIGDSDDVTATFEGYRADSLRYRVTTSRDVRIVENEIAWPGWKIEVCNVSRCSEDNNTTSTSQGLRTWNLKSGVWDVKLHFVGPSAIPGYLCALLGLLLALMIPATGKGRLTYLFRPRS